MATMAASWPGLPDYRGMEVLSPMVRASQLPLRLSCLSHGADLVYSGVEVDRQIIETVRVENAAFGCVDYVSPRMGRAVWSTCQEERERVIFQVGTADPALAVRAALHVCRDVRGVDVNMGCTAPFSAQGGMGAALLDKPELAADILKSLRRELPADCSVSCKIRLLPTLERTRDFMQLCERSGVNAIAVHLRLQEEQRQHGQHGHPARWEDAAAVCGMVSVPVIANGDFYLRSRIDAFWKQCGADSGASPEGGGPARGPVALMVARGALWNPGIFHRGPEEEAPSYDEVVRGYIRTSVRVNAPVQNTKWVLREMLNRGHAEPGAQDFRGMAGKASRRFKQQLDFAADMGAICKLYDVDYNSSAFPPEAHTLNFYGGFQDSLEPQVEAEPTVPSSDLGCCQEEETSGLHVDCGPAGLTGDPQWLQDYIQVS